MICLTPASRITDPRNWSGGWYELSLELGHRDDERLRHALTAVWRAAAVVGCWGRTDRGPADQERAPLTVASLTRYGHLLGVVPSPFGGPVVCGCYASRLDDDVDWLAFYLPLGSLARVERRIGGFPFGPDGTATSLAWRETLDAWLADVAAQVFAVVDFRRGLIGFEPDPDLDDSGLHGQLLPTAGRLVYTPARR